MPKARSMAPGSAMEEAIADILRAKGAKEARHRFKSEVVSTAVCEKNHKPLEPKWQVDCDLSPPALPRTIALIIVTTTRASTCSNR